MKWFVAISGNIGSGKSTVTTLLSEKLGWAPYDALGHPDFMRYVFGVASEGKTRSSVMDEALRKYTRALGVHGDRKMLNRDE